MNSVIGALRVVLGADTAAFEKGLDGAQRTLRKFSRDMEKVSAKFASVGQSLTVGLTLPIAAFGAASLQAAQQSADAFGQVEAALKSMGGASGKTAEELQSSAKALQDIAAIDDDEILRNVTANLLTFGKVSGPVFDRAQVAIVDLATRMKMELQPATLLVGKALNDPIKGLTAMGRAGIQFTEDQKALIKSLVDAGRTAEAQTIILGELERQFGGSAKAAADTNPYARLKIAFGELSEVIGAKLLPIITPIVEKLTSLLQSFDRLSPAMQSFVVVGGLVAAAIGPILIGVGMLLSAVSTIAAFMAGPAVAGLVAFLAPFAPIILAVGALIGVLLLFREQVAPVLAEWGKTVADTLGPKIKPLIDAAMEAFGAFAALVAPLFQQGGVLHSAMAFFLNVATRIFNALVSMTGTQIEVLTSIFKALGALFRGDFSAMWDHLRVAAIKMVKGIGQAFAAMFPEVVAWVRKTWEGVKHWLVDKFVEIVVEVGKKVAAVAGFFKDLWDAVVGHSYVPDMVDGIRDEFARLDEVMVRPALKATSKVAQAFAKLRQDMASAKDNLGAWTNTPANDDRAGGHMGDGRAPTVWGGKPMDPEQVETLREKFVSFGRSFVDAVRHGRLEEFFASIADHFINKLIDQGLNVLFDAMGKTQGGGGGWGNVLSTVFSAFSGGSSVPGFATGGGFTVGGSGGVDSQLVRFWATPGEMVDIHHGAANDGGAGRASRVQVEVVPSDYFDVKVRQISGEGDARVMGAVVRGRQAEAQQRRYAIPGARGLG